MESAVKRNVFWKAVEAFATIAAGFVQLGMITRAYSPEAVGQYQLTLAWLFIVAAFAGFGAVSMIATRELSQGSSREHARLFSSAFVLQGVIAAAIGGTLYLGIGTFSTFDEIRGPLRVSTVILGVAYLLQLSQTLLISAQRMTTVVAVSLAGHVIATSLTWLACRSGCSVECLLVAWATYHLVVGIAGTVIVRSWRLLRPSAITVESIRHLATEVAPVSVMVVAAHLYIKIDVAILAYLLGDEVVAEYSAGYLFLDQLMVLSNFMMGALYPNFARAALERGSEFRALYRGILWLFVKYLFPIALLIAAFSHTLLELFFGARYAVAAPSLRILMLAALFAWINGPSGTIFISLKKQHVYMWATIMSFCLNVLLNLALIPYVGAIGAAIATMLTELSICSFCLYCIYRETGYLPWMKAQ